MPGSLDIAEERADPWELSFDLNSFQLIKRNKDD